MKGPGAPLVSVGIDQHPAARPARRVDLDRLAVSALPPGKQHRRPVSRRPLADRVRAVPRVQVAVRDRLKTDPEFAEKWGELGPVYGKQWRDFKGPSRQVDQIKRLIDGLRDRPDSRRHLVSAWHPAELEERRFPPATTPSSASRASSRSRSETTCSSSGRIRTSTSTSATATRRRACSTTSASRPTGSA